MSVKYNPVEAFEAEVNAHTSKSSAPVRSGFLARFPACLFSIEALVCVVLLLGTIFVFYPKDSDRPRKHPHHASLGVAHRNAVPEPPQHHPNKNIPDDKLAAPNIPAAAAAPATTPAPQVIEPFDGPHCFAGVNEGDHCAAFVSGYGITSIERLIEMNPGLTCPADALMTVGHAIFIRKGQGCGTECTKELC
ncbi:hypothetical protein BV898_02580 [Hypsibius exemplaris]|uniref:LysM domain-containing protein n=1 Tax=Hypsibius exemplaris TaxID=2072580 RepID=A0A1W0X7E7_HYPEX|nr:hypothetical protein BV898_02580 [Hypsibius exemplaris]